jgi:hypothetical protein
MAGFFTALVAFFTAVGEFFKALNVILPDLWKEFYGLVCTLKTYYYEKAQREKDAQEQLDRARIQAQIAQAAKEAANLKACLLMRDEIWKTRYEQILAFVKAHEYDSVLIVCDGMGVEEINSVLFSNELPEFIAMKICEYMRKKDFNGIK